jgi:hypothetical protein
MAETEGIRAERDRITAERDRTAAERDGLRAEIEAWTAGGSVASVPEPAGAFIIDWTPRKTSPATIPL